MIENDLPQLVQTIDEDDHLVGALETAIPRYQRALRRAIERAEGPERLTIAQLRCLQAIAANPGGETLTTKLARQMGVSAPSISSMIDGLVERDLVERLPKPDDRRQIRLLITDDGRTSIQRYEAAIADHLHQLFKPLGARSRRRLLRAMTDLVGLIEASDANDEERGEA